MEKKPIVAIVYDFDGTLSPGNMQEFGFIQAVGKSPKEFWERSEEIAKGQDASGILAYMKLMLDEARSKGIQLRREDFVSFGKRIELFPGVREWFSAVNQYGKSRGVIVEHYINSSGLAEMIEGADISHEFKKVYASGFLYDENGLPIWPAVAVDFTAKTQFLFKINKGILSIGDNTLVNESLKEEDKRVPFSHMIYFGDGQTDVPCMKIVKMFGGHSVAVYNPEKPGDIKAARTLFRQQRVNFTAPTDYRRESPTFSLVCKIINKIKADYDLGVIAKKTR